MNGRAPDPIISFAKLHYSCSLTLFFLFPSLSLSLFSISTLLQLSATYVGWTMSTLKLFPFLTAPYRYSAAQMSVENESIERDQDQGLTQVLLSTGNKSLFSEGNQRWCQKRVVGQSHRQGSFPSSTCVVGPQCGKRPSLKGLGSSVLGDDELKKAQGPMGMRSYRAPQGRRGEFFFSFLFPSPLNSQRMNFLSCKWS